MRRSLRVMLSVVAALPVLGTLGATDADAGVYRVYSCKTPAGNIAPTDGWTGTAIAPQTSPSNTCASGGSLTIALNAAIYNPATASMMSWRFSAPSGGTISAYRVWRNAQLTGANEPNATPVAFVARPLNAFSGAYVAEACRAAPEGCAGLGGAPGVHPGNLIAESLDAVPDATQWFISVDCGGVGGYVCVPRPAGHPMASASVYAAEFTLRDPQPPAVTQVAGRVTTATTHSGVEQLTFSASDPVSGVYRSILEVDGKVVRAAVISANDGRCADAGVDPATPYEFMYREPCPKSVQHDFALDTRTLTDGTHNVRVSVEDASGNRTGVWSEPEFVVQNAPAAGGVAGATGAGGAEGANGAAGANPTAPCTGATTGLAARYRRNGARTLRVRHRQAFNITGRGPANTDVDVFHARGGKFTALGSFRTSAAGTFTERVVARQGNGTLFLCGPGLVAKLTLKVRAVVKLTVRISRGGLVRYSGRVRTGHIPKGGKIVAIQGKAGPSWQTFALRRTSRTGRFKGRYRLRVVRPGAKLKFRVRVPSEAGYPFVGVVGKSITKRVR
ncbi:hypothetical protein LRS13_00880 [Svornostia abyssi]|uniref:Uncharacterized protein n=1 Tax=Svornostia abyssi TaxID=2898438 RepID=A0ABY5PHM9_9ACTN|nr:hypothetical protein LRS13_00880 [Parviterribacteraceae bacterium J379]